MNISAPNMPKLRRPTKKVVIISVIVLLLAGIGTYGTFSYFNWQTLEQRSTEAAASIKTVAEEALADESSSKTPAERIDGFVTEFDAAYGDEPCTTSQLYTWQTVIPAIKEGEQRCQDRFADALALKDALLPLRAFLTAETEAATLLAETITATDGQTDYAKSATAWAKVADSDRLSDDDVFGAVKAEVAKFSDAVSAAYTALAKAIKDEDKTAFDDATAALDDAYKDLSTINATSVKERLVLIDVVVDVYEKL